MVSIGLMHRFLDLVRRFRRDERGAFAVIFGVTAIVLVALSGAVVDYVGIEQARSRGQIALDAAALALQPKIFSTTVTKADLQAQAQAILVDRIGDVSGVTAKVLNTIINKDEGTLYFVAELKMPTMFVSLVGVTQLNAQIQSEATRKKLELEVAFVLDNSGSMTETGAGANGTRQRIQFLRDAAKCAVNILFYKDTVNSPTNADTCIPATGAQKLDDVKVGLVPFTMFVNVGNTNQSAGWIDKGNSVTANDNFDDGRSIPGNINRFDLFAATKTSWEGCVEARPHIKSGTAPSEYLDTDDTAPSGGNTQFVPMLAPDISDVIAGESLGVVDTANSGTNSYLADNPLICDRPATTPTATTCTVKERRTGCNSDYSNSGSCQTITQVSGVPSGPVNFPSTAKYPNGYYGAHSPSCSCRTSTGTWVDMTGSGTNRTFERVYDCPGGGYIPKGLSNRQMQERICKYYDNVKLTSATRGPNADCGNSAILPLNTTPTMVTTAITNMVAEGGTNIHEGTAWGLRVLSPGEPFAEGDAYSENIAKIMIVMTDGENTAYNLASPNYCGSTTMRQENGSCFNSAYGYSYNSKNNNENSSSGGTIERLGSLGPGTSGSVSSPNAELVKAMNERTLQACTNAKAKGITVYTIGLATAEASQSTQAVVENMLTQCASSTDKAKFPQSPGDLKAIFQAIANDLTQLRLVK